MKVIVYRRLDNRVCIVNPAPKFVAQLIAQGLAEDEAIMFIQDKDVPPNARNVEVMDNSLIPKDRVRRNQWVKTRRGPPIDPGPPEV